MEGCDNYALPHQENQTFTYLDVLRCYGQVMVLAYTDCSTLDSASSLNGSISLYSLTTIRLSDGRHRQEQHNGFRKSSNRRQD
jgi:hypothetical protein